MAKQQTVADFLTNPQPTVLPFTVAGTPAVPLAQYMIAGSPPPRSAQQRIGDWNRATSSIPMTTGVTYNAPRNRMGQV